MKRLVSMLVFLVLFFSASPVFADVILSIGGGFNEAGTTGQASISLGNEQFKVALGMNTFPAYFGEISILAYQDTYIYAGTSFSDDINTFYAGWLTIMPLNPTNQHKGRFGIGFAGAEDTTVTYLDCGLSLLAKDNLAIDINTRLFFMFHGGFSFTTPAVYAGISMKL